MSQQASICKIHFRCPKCETNYAALPKQAGRKGQFKRCGATIAVLSSLQDDASFGVVSIEQGSHKVERNAAEEGKSLARGNNAIRAYETDQAIFWKSLTDLRKNAVFYGIGALATFWLGSSVRIFAIILCAICCNYDV